MIRQGLSMEFKRNPWVFVTMKVYRITIYAPLIYTSPCIMFWMRAYPLHGEVGGGWALEFPIFLGPVKWERAQKTREFQGPTPSHFPTLWICTHPKHYARSCMNHINSWYGLTFMRNELHEGKLTRTGYRAPGGARIHGLSDEVASLP